MSQYAEPLLALRLDVVCLEYVETVLIQEGSNVLCIDTPLGTSRIFVIGNGDKKILFTSGFSLYDYRLVNTLTLLFLNSIRFVRPEGGLREVALSKARFYLYPVVNHFAFSRAVALSRAFKRSLFDEHGIHVMYDNIVLQSRYSTMFHYIVSNIRPHILLILATDRSLGKERNDKVNVRVYSKDEETTNSIVQTLQTKLNNVNVIKEEHININMPHVHYVLENLTSVGLLVEVPYGNDIVDNLYSILIEIVERLATLDVKPVEELRCNEKYVDIELSSDKEENINILTKSLQAHGIQVEPLGGTRVRVKYCENIQLHKLLIDQRLLEKYFRITILSSA